MAGDEAGARGRITAAASSLFADRGFAAVSVADIAGTCGVSTGLVYYHFKDKQTLFETVVREGMHLLEDVAVRTLSVNSSPTERLRSFVSEYMALLAERTSLMRLLIRSVTDLGGPAPQQVLMRSVVTIERIQTVIAEGIASGEFRDLDAHLAATSLFALASTLTTARVFETPIGMSLGNDGVAQAAFMTDLFLKGIASCS
jgi:AcrR family transcriptional regulator